MDENTAEKVEETTRRYMREAEDAAQDAFRVGNDLMTTGINYYFDSFSKLMRQSMELTNYAQRATDDMLSIYRRMYSDGIKTWQEYSNDVNKIVVRPTR